MRYRSGWRGLFLRGWSWPAFLLAFGWYFYRKQYIAGGIMVVLPIVLGVVSHGAGGLSWIGFAVIGKTSYVRQGLNRIVEADSRGLQGEARAEFLQQAGGVSWTAGLIAGGIYLAMIALVVFQIATRHTPTLS
jgi:hypothetical protein